MNRKSGCCTSRAVPGAIPPPVSTRRRTSCVGACRPSQRSRSSRRNRIIPRPPTRDRIGRWRAAAARAPAWLWTAPASSDPDGDPLTFAWSGRFGTATGVSPTVSLPLGPSLVSLVVRDGESDSAPDVTSIAVVLEPDGFLAPVNAPLAPAGSPLVPPREAFKAGRTLPLRLRLLCGTHSAGAVPRRESWVLGGERLTWIGPLSIGPPIRWTTALSSGAPGTCGTTT
jgi:hypothetical protein